MVAGLSRPSLALAAVAAGAVALMALPLPGFVVDVLIAINALVAAGLLVIAVTVARPTVLGSFPALLLIAAVLRLGVAVAAARLVLAGTIGAGLRLVEGALLVNSVAVATLVFVGLVVVHHVVVARGAERIAEVAARFALDALPGRQLGIDADVRTGGLDAAAAQRLRHELSSEGQMFAAMDGAMKFVRGEALATLLIVGVVLLGATAAGVGREQSIADSARQAALAAAAVGVVVQLPALLSALASGVLASRAGMNEPRGLGGALVEQVRTVVGSGPTPVAARLAVETAPGQGDLGDALASRIQDSLESLGLARPAVARRTAEDVPAGSGRVLLDGAPLGVTEGDRLASVEASLRRHVQALLGVEETQRLLDRLATTHPTLVRETVPKIVPVPMLADVLQRLVRESVPLEPLRDVLEAIARNAPAEPRASQLCEAVRTARARALTHRFCPNGRAAAIVVDPEVEDAIREAERGDSTAIDPEISQDIVSAVRAQLEGVSGDRPVLLCAAEVRRPLRDLLEPDFPDLPVLSYRELLPELGIDTLGRITIGGAT